VSASVTIIGAGISGLACAWRLQRLGWNVRVLERSDRAGGVVESARLDGFLVERGPNTMRLNSRGVATMIEELGLTGRMQVAAPSASKRFIVRNGRPVALPRSPLGFFRTQWLSPSAKLSLFREPFVRRPSRNQDESIASMIRRRLGQEWLDYAVEPFIAGIYAGDPEKLSARWAFPRLWHLEEQHGSFLLGGLRTILPGSHRDPDRMRPRLISFPEGLGEIPTALAMELGDNIQTNANIVGINSSNGKWCVRWRDQHGDHGSQSDALVIATPAYAAEALPLPATCRPVQNRLVAVEHPPVTSVSLGFRRAAIRHPLDGFGMLTPAVEHRTVLGALFSSTLFAGRAPEGHVLITTYVGGARDPQLADMNETELVEMIIRELEELLGVSSPPVFAKVFRHPTAIPQFTVGHGELLRALEANEQSHPRLYWAGSYRAGISLVQCFRGALDLAARIHDEQSTLRSMHVTNARA
jgi:oxygen-dependent protoporphyrinogen oxidase